MRTANLFGVVALGLVHLVFTGCTSLVVTPTNQDITIISKQEKVNVYVDGRLAGITPLTIKYPRRVQPCVILQKDGYEPRQLRIRRQATRQAHFDGCISLIPTPWTMLFPLFNFCSPGRLVEYASPTVNVDMDGMKSDVNPKGKPLWDVRPIDKINDRDRKKGMPPAAALAKVTKPQLPLPTTVNNPVKAKVEVKAETARQPTQSSAVVIPSSKVEAHTPAPTTADQDVFEL